MAVKTCTKCGESKPLTEFHRNRCNGLEARRPDCRTCQSVRNKAYSKANRARESARVHAWNVAHPEHVKARNRAWYLAHREEHLERSRQYLQNNREKVRETKRQYHSRRPEVRKAIDAKRRAVPGSHTAEDLQRILAGQKYRCWWCGCKLKKYHVDHRIPVGLGGTNDPSNLVMACVPCNVRKWKKTPAEFCGRLL
jgi:5-methylcytosine-specific restriction endonuclease McrA